MDMVSIIIPSYNTKDITLRCLNSLDALLQTKDNAAIPFDIIIVDNASTDGSIRALYDFINEKKDKRIIYRLISLSTNLGFSKANNVALKQAKGSYILFLNSDVIVNNIDFKELMDFFSGNQKIGVLTVQVNLFNNRIDPASHRGFPTIWRSFCYFSKLEYMFGKIPVLNSLFGGYHLTYKDVSTIHEIDSPSGAFYMVRKDIVVSLGGFDEEFFMYGEDIDLSFRIKKSGYSVYYYPFFSVTHLKGSSGFNQGTKYIKNKTKHYFFDAMKIFYRKHYARLYHPLINRIMYSIIDIKEQLS